MSAAGDYAERRHAARLAAVQALYQMELGGRGASAVVREFRQHRLGRDAALAEGEAVDEDAAGEARLGPTDEAHFADVVEGVARARAEIDDAVSAALAEGWRLARLDATARAILRCAAYEILLRPDVPARVTIDGYVEITKDFFDGGPEPGFVNAALDALARRARVGDLAER